MGHSHHYNMYRGIAMRWGRRVLCTPAEDGMEVREGFPEGMHDNSEAAGRAHAVERTSQCCTSRVGLHLAVAGKTNGHLGQDGALESAQVAVEDTRKGWQRREAYQQDETLE